MAEKQSQTEGVWPVSWKASRKAQFQEMANSSPVQRLEWLEQALRLAQATGALAKAETRDQRKRRGC